MDSELNNSLNKLTIKAVEETPVMQPIIHCGDLSLRTTSAEPKLIFENYNVVNVVLKKTPNNQYSYAFVYLDSAEAAKKAVEELKYTKIHDKEIIMSLYNPQNKNKEEGNIFVNNLPSEMTTKDLDALFRVFGDIVSCKISTDMNGASKGYGFVKYKSSKAAKRAVANCKNLKLGENTLFVELFDRNKQKRNVGVMHSVFTNCYVKNFPPTYTKEKLENLLSKYGKITDIYFPMKENNTPSGFACVNFEKPEAAIMAIHELHDQKIFSNAEMEKGEEFSVEPFYIQKAEKKKERVDSFKDQIGSGIAAGSKLKKNLYIKNVPETFSREEILSVLKEFGEITDLYLAKDTNHPTKQYGFVCYATLEEAAYALERSKQVLLDGNQLELIVYKNKLEREIENANMDSSRIEKSSQFNDLKSKLIEIIEPIASNYTSQWSFIQASNKNEFVDKITDSLLNLPSETIDAIINRSSEMDKQISQILKNYEEILNRN